MVESTLCHDTRPIDESASFVVQGPQPTKAQKRRVTFSDSFVVHKIPRISEEEVVQLFYSKHELRALRRGERLLQDQRDEHIIQRFIVSALDEMELQLIQTKKVQDVERILVKHARKLSDKMKRESLLYIIRDPLEARDDETSVLEEEPKNEKEEEQSLNKHFFETDWWAHPTACTAIYTESQQFQEIAALLEQSSTEELEFTTVGFDSFIGPLCVDRVTINAKDERI